MLGFRCCGGNCTAVQLIKKVIKCILSLSAVGTRWISRAQSPSPICLWLLLFSSCWLAGPFCMLGVRRRNVLWDPTELGVLHQHQVVVITCSCT